jgi:hypothetical protein
MKKTKHEKQGLGKQERKTRKEENKVSDTLWVCRHLVSFSGAPLPGVLPVFFC